MSITVHPETGVVALGDAILACLTERPMTGYELAKTFDNSIGFSGRPTTSKFIGN